MKKKPIILFAGDIANISMSSYQRCDVLRRLGYEVHSLDYYDFKPPVTFTYRCRRRFFGRQLTHDYETRLNMALRGLCKTLCPDIVWMEWPRAVHASTLEAMREAWPHAVFVCFQDDNPFGERRAELGAWALFIKNIPFFDIHFVKRKEDLIEFKARGARRVELAMHGVYNMLFRLQEAPASVDYGVSFVGTALDHRVGHITELFEKHRLSVDVFGPKWYKTSVHWRHFNCFHRTVSGQSYVDVIWRSAISLAFVSSSNHDEYTMRTFEIPGAGGFFLAERTPVHCELYEEGVEAEFFSSPAECADKIRFYLAHSDARLAICAAGRSRCVRSDYSLESRMRESISKCI